MSDEFKITSTLSCDTVEFNAAMERAAGNVKEFKNIVEAQTKIAAKAAAFFGVKTREVMKEFAANTKTALKETEDAFKSYAKVEEAAYKSIVKEARKAQKEREKVLKDISTAHSQALKEDEKRNAKSEADKRASIQKHIDAEEKRIKVLTALFEQQQKEQEKANKKAEKDQEASNRRRIANENDTAKEFEKIRLRVEKSVAKDTSDEMKFHLSQGSSEAAGAVGAMGMGGLAIVLVGWEVFKAAASVAWNAVKFAAETAWSAIKAISSTVIDGILNSIDRVAQQMRKALNYDETITNYRKLEFAAKQTGIALNTLEAAFRALEKNTGKGTFGDKSSTSAFQKLGIDPNEFAKLGMSEQMDKMAGAFATISNTSQRAAIAMQLFGRSGTEILEFLRELKENKDTFERITKPLTTFDATKIRDAKMALGEIQTIIENIYDQITAMVAPAITNIIRQFEEWGFTGKKLEGTIVSIFTMLIKSSATAIASIMSLAQTFKFVWDVANGLWSAIPLAAQIAFKAIVGYFVPFSGIIMTNWKAIFSGASNAFSKIVDVGVFSANSIIQVFVSMKNTLKEIFTFIANSLITTLNYAISGLTSNVNLLIKGFNLVNGTNIKPVQIQSIGNSTTTADKDNYAISRLPNGNINLDNMPGMDSIKSLMKSLSSPFKAIGAEYDKNFNKNFNAVWEKMSEILTKTGKYPGDIAPKTGDLKDMPNEKKEHKNPLGYALNLMGMNTSIEALRSAASNEQDVSDKKGHEIMNKQLKAMKAFAPRAV